MSAADQPMKIQSIIWHVSTNSVEMVFQSMEPPPPPEWADGWYGGAGDRLVAVVPVKKSATALAPTGWTRTGTNPDGTDRFTMYTYNGTAWVNPRPVDINGKPL
jgi:hypothetical protein